MDKQSKHIDKTKVYQSGLRAEFLASLWLRLKGYRLIETRYKTPGGEIDLIVKRKNHFSFVEVKYRQTLDLAAFSLSTHQKKRINKAALYWLAKQGDIRYDSLSFDVVLCAPWRLPLHIENAFEEM